jgi:uncharacterized protein YjbI with pentapeptide repeats/DNA-binding XRE family transcriptional regulator
METKIIGNKISEARKKLNMSQAQLAESLFISPQAVGKWERGESMPDITTFGRLAKILGVDLNYFSANAYQAENNGLGHDPSSEYPEANPDPSAKLDLSANSDLPANSARDNKKRPVRNMSTNAWKDVDFSGLNNIKETVNSANFQNCKFLGSDLAGLIWKNDVLHLCDFSRSDLNLCRFQGSNLEGARFNGCSLVEANFSASTLKGCDFERADLTGTFFNFSTISKIRTQDAILNGTAFKDSQIEEVVFEGSMENCHFEKCGFKKVEFRDASLINTFFKYNNNLKKVVFTNCKVDSLTYAFLKSDKANTEGLTLIQDKLKEL